jgi:hypothetical protein
MPPPLLFLLGWCRSSRLARAGPSRRVGSNFGIPDRSFAPGAPRILISPHHNSSPLHHGCPCLPSFPGENQVLFDDGDLDRSRLIHMRRSWGRPCPTGCVRWLRPAGRKGRGEPHGSGVGVPCTERHGAGDCNKALLESDAFGVRRPQSAGRLLGLTLGKMRRAGGGLDWH